ncbi:33748_t:CDS:2, partial [Gigaspora margarita]
VNMSSIPSHNEVIMKDQNSIIQQYNSIPTNDSQYPIVLIKEPINISSNNESISTSSNDPFSVKGIQKEKDTNYIRKKFFKEKGTLESVRNNQNEQKSNCKSDYDSREQDKGKQVELSESSSDSDELGVEKTSNKRIGYLVSTFKELQIGNINISTIYSNNLKAPSEYIKNLKKIRTKKEMNGDIFSSNKDPKDLQGMFSQRINFNEGSTSSISLEPLPKHLQE